MNPGCHVELAQTKEEIEALPNGTELLGIYQDNDIESWHDFLYYLAQTLGCFAVIDRYGKLSLASYGSTPVMAIDIRHRFSSSFSDFVTRYTAVSSTNKKTETAKYYAKDPDDGLTMNLGVNPLLQFGLEETRTRIINTILDVLSLDIPIYFEKENINTGSMESELFLSILSSMAEGESASISENNKWSIKKCFLDGTYKLGYMPYGYCWKDGEILVDPEQAEIVKRIFRELLSGKGTEAIAKELNQEQVPTKKSGCWTSTSIRDIIRNEKYTGDCIFQKTYTDSNFNRHKNDGHLDQYYVPDHHEAIISHEDFEAAAALIEQRASEKGIKKGNAKYQQRYAFSSKIICSECGNTFRRRIHSSTYGKYAAWVCNTHLEDTSRCSMLYIRDDDLKLAFTTMINKLVYCHKLVLKPYLKVLQENTGDASLLNIQQLEMLLEQNTEQRETLHRLMGQGYIDQILFTQENNILLSQAGEYRNQIELLNRSQSLDATKVYETERLLHFCERGEMQLEYSEELFELFVDHIEVYSRQKIGFALHCGLILKEMI